MKITINIIVFVQKCIPSDNHYQDILNIDQRLSPSIHFFSCAKEMKKKGLKINKKTLAEYAGRSRTTVHKYWDQIEKEINKQ